MLFTISVTSERSRASITQGVPGGGKLRHHPLPPSVLHALATSGRPPVHQVNPSFTLQSPDICHWWNSTKRPSGTKKGCLE